MNGRAGMDINRRNNLRAVFAWFGEWGQGGCGGRLECLLQVQRVGRNGRAMSGRIIERDIPRRLDLSPKIFCFKDEEFLTLTEWGKDILFET